MTKLTRQRARQAARSDATAAAKLIAVQEVQIDRSLESRNGRICGRFGGRL